MKHVQRETLLDYVTYEGARERLRTQVMAIKAPRRVHVGGVLTFLFENTDTVRYQVQEMMRAERIVREADILHELSTYNELLGGPGELGCTLLIEIVDALEREAKLRAWTDLPKHLWAELSDGSRVAAKFDERQIGDERLSSVHYLKFPVRGRVPSALVVDHPELQARTALAPACREALAEDLAADL